MKILYISSIPSTEQFNYMKDQIKSNVNISNYGMHESGFKFHHLILNGLKKNKVEVYSLIGRPTSFKKYKGIIWRRKIDVENDITYNHLGYLNLPLLKNIILCFEFLFNTLHWIKSNKDERKCIIVDAAYISVLPFINFATKLRKCKKIAIVCDIYQYMADVKDARDKSSKFHKFVSRLMSNVYRKIDGYVFLTEAMNNVLNKLGKPYIIMEGLVDCNMKSSVNSLKNKTNKKIIMYAGALREQYGLKNLMEGYERYDNPDSELWIYGAGDYSKTIKRYAEKDKRLKFFGLKPNEEIVKNEIIVDVLINPRPANQEFTKYSFPSKNMEYMVSGTPILTTRLSGMPSQYYDYIYTIDGDDSESIKEAIEKTLILSKKELNDKGKLAKDFVLSQKNNIVQSKRIIELCRKVID